MIDSDFTWIVGDKDKLTPLTEQGFQRFTSGQYQRMVFPGDHFFVFQSPEDDQDVADECVNVVRRCVKKFRRVTKGCN